MTTASPGPGPEVLTLGMRPDEGLSRRARLVLCAVVGAVVTGLVGWWAWPDPPSIFSLDDLRGVYAGMVRSDGTNDASVITRTNLSEQAGYLVPSACEPLFEATVLNRMPQQALDGVGTYWELNRSAVSLFTYRFADIASADREYQRLADVFDGCRNLLLQVHARPAVMGTLTGVPVSAGPSEKQLRYLLTTDDGTKLTVHVLSFSNTVSWQFRYVPPLVPYTPLLAQRVVDSLAEQMRAVLALHQ